ncbi:MAG: thioredoxin domain-containing protein [Peptococcaceae bacterium]|nr:thioredoxin domain-containing protein [Peptococcaceae bacterium]
MANALQYEKSPYLLQHQHNPVNWMPWGEAAFRKAALEDKPVFLSIGYSTCHWCHVMARESFEDEETADVLNNYFICIKVDREERPDVDAVYMAVCQAMTGSGGWPLTVFLTPEQKPFFAGTYFPKRRRYGQPGLMELLERIHHLWEHDREQLLQTGDQITAAMQEVYPADGREPQKTILAQACQQLRRQYDKTWGGFGPAPKFPTPHNLLFLMRYAALEQKPDGLDMAAHTLQAMACGGIRDHIGGGFSRYSTDTQWLVPHFEKMLYDNALLILAYLEAYQQTQEEAYAQVVRSTADYVLRELTDDRGGFYCGQDADSDGVEGKYYVFTPQETEQILGETDGQLFNRLYGITEQGNFEGNSIPNRIGQTEPGWRHDDARLKKLYDYRLQRTALHKDDKVLLSWNGWMILALARAGFLLDEPCYLEVAKQAQQFIEANITDADNRLFVRWREGEAAHTGQLDDYAVYGLALLELYQVTLEPVYLQQAILRARQMTALFADEKSGGYFLTAADAETLIIRPKETYDGAIPSGNSAAAMLLQKLAYLTGEAVWQEAAHRQMQFMAGEMNRYPAGHCFALLAMADALYPHRELVCVTREGIPEALRQYQKGRRAENTAVLLKTPETSRILTQCAPFTADYSVPEQGTLYYLCENGACKAPADHL